MLKNYVPRKHYTTTEHRLVFYYDDNGGFAFPCDENGNVLPGLSPEAEANLKWCLEHPEKFAIYNKVRTEHRKVYDNAHGTCICGCEVELWDQYLGACECECGRWYNLFGQELLRPEYWDLDE